MNIIEKYSSKYSEEKLIRWFKQVCLAEAVSWFLLFTAMVWIRVEPKDLFAIIYISTMGSIHGLFFTFYLLLLLPVKKIFKWDDEDSIFALCAAFFPFATIWVEKKLADHHRNQE